MKMKLFFGAMAVGVSMCSQSFGFDLLDRMLGANGSGNCCEPVTCCEQTVPEVVCKPAAPKYVVKKRVVYEKVAVDPCESTCRPRHDLFAGLKGLFDHKHSSACCDVAPVCEAPKPVCKPAPVVVCKPKPVCKPAPVVVCKPKPVCKPAPVVCKPQPVCETTVVCKPRIGLLHRLFAHRASSSCCEASPCGDACSTAFAHGEIYESSAPTPAEADEAPVPPAPIADPSASYDAQPVFQTSKYVRTR